MQRSRSARRVVGALVVLTAAVLVVALARPGWADPVRMRAASAFAPILGWTAPAAHGSAAAEQDTALSDALRRSEEERASTAQLEPLLATPALGGARVVAARVVAVGTTGAAGPERVTVDAGTQDGVTVDQPVVTAVGLVGRTVSVTARTSDVQVLGGPGLRVGVRVGSSGTLGLVTADAGLDATAGRLSLQVVQPGRIEPGDQVTTLGSPDGRPFVAGISVGSVTSVDTTPGRVATTGAVRPSVDLATLDVVGIVLSAPRTTPRPSATAVAR